jgi:EthD domain
MTVTVVTLLKRRPGMTKADFIAYYEASHRVIGEQVLRGYATRYVRRFLFPTDGVETEHDPDVLTEITFSDEVTRAACFAAMADPAIMAMIVADEEKLFDRSRIKTFEVEERDSEL